jgi:hypothetical protein
VKITRNFGLSKGNSTYRIREAKETAVLKKRGFLFFTERNLLKTVKKILKESGSKEPDVRKRRALILSPPREN